MAETDLVTAKEQNQISDKLFIGAYFEIDLSQTIQEVFMYIETYCEAHTLKNVMHYYNHWPGT